MYVQLLKRLSMVKFNAQIWPFLKLACFSETAAAGAKISSTSTPWGQTESICATSKTFANGQVSCPNMAILKNGLYLENRCL